MTGSGAPTQRSVRNPPANVPNLMRIAEQGVIAPNVNVMNNGHFGATMTLFTGNTEYRGIRENDRGPNPTLFEYVRKDLSLPANDVWVTTSGGAQQVNYSHGTHADYGSSFGANTLDGDGIENSQATLVARNCIVWGNGDEDLRSFMGNVDVTYCDIPWA